MRPYTDKQFTTVSKALSDPMRFLTYQQQISAQKEITAGDLEVCTLVSKPTVSHHLKVLARAGLVEHRRDRQFIYYRAIPESLAQYCLCLTSLLKVVKASKV